ncbi:MAG: DUF1292 domain-containing protein [Miniphocaeibacter sp.]|uniref:DUF1292 domain-containing protein n=1 Tax=Miniphocaeibacter sp. TaxID=3100973 RepID=UPI001843E5DC|nr:DUF1292 domain-containing protein [Gallicola sp.]
MEIIELYDESGNLHKYELLDTFGMDDNDYAALLTTNKEDNTIYIFRIKRANNGEIILEGIEDEEELKDAVEIYEKLKGERIQ